MVVGNRRCHTSAHVPNLHEAFAFLLVSTGSAQGYERLHTEEAMSAIVSIDNLTKPYDGGFQALKGVPLDIEEGEILSLLGPNGAGKTTLTEKFLLYGGAIQVAGQVRAKGEARRTRSDFMQMEKDRGISV